MGVLVGVLLPIALCVAAALVARYELSLYRDSHEFDSELFVYTKGRLIRRMTGVVLLAAVGITLAAMEFFPAGSGAGASLYLALLIGEIVALLVLPVLDLLETGRGPKTGPAGARLTRDRQDVERR